MARRMMVVIAAASMLTLLAAPAMAQDEDLEVRPGLWVTGFEFVGGDGDAVAEPGERLKLWVDLQHGGDAAVTDVRGILRSLTDDVRVIEDGATWADIGSGENARSRVAFVIEVSETAKIQDTRCDAPIGIEPLPAEEPPVDGGGDDPVTSVPPDEPVSSDGSGSGGGTVSSDGTVTKDPDGGGADGSAGQSEPGYAGEGATPEELEAEQRAAEQEKLQAEETEVTPVEESVAEEGAPERGEEPAPEPAEYEPGVHVSLSLAVSSSLGEEELFVDNGLVCTMLESAAGDGGQRDVALGADDKVASASRAPAIASASVLLGAMGLTLGSIAWRRRPTI